MEAYLPLTIQWPPPAVGNATTPLFPGYLFARLALPADYYTASWTPGVREFVRLDRDEPARVATDAIELLRAREAPDGLIHCGEDMATDSPVRLIRGPLKDLCGVVDRRLSARGRVVLLIDFLQKSARVEAPESWVASVH